MTKIQISQAINSLMVNQRMVDRALDAGNTDRAQKAMEWYNDVADSLIACGIPVIKFNVSGN